MIELSSLCEEFRTYKIVGSDYCYLIRHEYRDLSVSSYKWHISVEYREVDKMGYVLSSKVVFVSKNYSRDTNQRKFREFLFANNFSVVMMSMQRSFLTKDKNVV